jgi:histidinol-phosphate aminotransferase
MTFTRETQQDFAKRGFSRRSFGRLAALIAAGPALPFYNEFTLAAQDLDMSAQLAGVVKIDTNENPLGPCPEAAEAMRNVVAGGGRYMFHLAGEFQSVLAEQEGLRPGYVQAYPGSSMPLHWSVLAFTSPTRPLITADPGYEAAEGAARFVGAKVVRVPLRKDWAHDVNAMASADANAGLIYICNPNNPTGTITPRADLDYLIANKPRGAIVVLDEAYIHFTDVPGASDMVATDKDVIILRTFSKIYGMAGLRAGAALARPDLLARIRGYGNTWVPATSMVGATASLKSRSLVPDRRKITRSTREDVFSFFDSNGFQYIPSVSNHFLVDVKRPGREIMSALRGYNVLIGRTWPSLPTHVRVTVGTPEEMNKFKQAFLKVTA